MSSKTQREKIIAFCEEHGSITVRDAFLFLNINSPTKRISELRKDGYPVSVSVETKKNGNGELVRFNRYFIGRKDA